MEKIYETMVFRNWTSGSMAVIPERQKLNKLSCVIAQAYCLESINSGRGTQEEPSSLLELRRWY